MEQWTMPSVKHVINKVLTFLDLAAVTSFMQGNLFSLSRLEGGGTSRPLRGSRDSASRNRFSVGPFSLIAAPCSSSMASESEWERMGGAGIGVDVQGERKEHGDRGALSWGENTPLWPGLPSLTSKPSPRRVFSSLCNCTGKDIQDQSDGINRPVCRCVTIRSKILILINS